MARFLTLLMIVTLMVANGSAVAGAICRHQDAREHAIARWSQDAQVRTGALMEDAAAAAASKKGALGSVASLALPAYVLPPATLPAVPPAAKPMHQPDAESAPLPSRSIRPLLEPPVA